MKKFLNYKFLMTVLAAVVVLLEVLMDVFKINLNIEAVISVSVAIIGLMVTIGIVDKDKTDKDVKTREDLKDFEKNNKSEDDNDKTAEIDKTETESIELIDADEHSVLDKKDNDKE